MKLSAMALVIALAGAVSGVVAAVTVSFLLPRAEGAAEKKHDGAPTAAAPIVKYVVAPGAQAPSELANERAPTEAGSSDAEAGDAEWPEPSEDEPRMEDVIAERIAGVASEQVDSTWAPAARQSFQADLDTLSMQIGASVVDVDCRTKSCVATVEWQSYDDAKKTWKRLIHEPYKENCAVSMSVDPPADGNAASYQAKVLFECSGNG